MVLVNLRLLHKHESLSGIHRKGTIRGGNPSIGTDVCGAKRMILSISPFPDSSVLIEQCHRGCGPVPSIGRRHAQPMHSSPVAEKRHNKNKVLIPLAAL